VLCHCKYGAAAAWLEEERFAEIVRTIPPLALGGWRWPKESSRFYGARGAFMYAGGNRSPEGKMGYSAWISAKTEHPLQFLKPLLDDSWEYVAI
jgi:hypothetical protein